MSDIQNTSSEKDAQAAPQLVLGQIPAEGGVCRALEAVGALDPFRNAVFFVNSSTISGRLGIFCNQFITGAVVDKSGETGVKALELLLSAKVGMFGFRPSLGDETKELGQSLLIDVRSVRELFKEGRSTTEIEDILELLSTAAASATTRNITPVSKAKASTQPPANAPSAEQHTSLALRRLGGSPSVPVEGTNADVFMYREFIQEEERKVREDIERTLSKGSLNPDAQKVLAEMEALGELLQGQADFVEQRWEGLDDIPRPANLTHTPQVVPVLRETRPKNPKAYLKKTGSHEILARPTLFDSHQQLVVIGLGVLVIMVVAAATVLHGSTSLNFLDKGKQYFKARELDRAAQAFTVAIGENPNCAEAYFMRGLVNAETGKLDEAENDLRKAAELGTSPTQIKLAEAGLCCHRKEWNQALTLYDQLPADKRQSADVCDLRANCYLQLGDYTTAISQCTKGLKLTTNPLITAQLRSTRGFAYMKSNLLDKAVSDFDKAIEIHPDKKFFMLRGAALSKLKQHGKAVDDYRQVIKLDPSNYDAYVACGICEAALEQNDAALKDFTEALKIHRWGVEALIQRGSLYLKLKDYRSAANDLQDAHKLNPTIKETEVKLTEACRHLKNAGLPSPTVKKLVVPSALNDIIAQGYKSLNEGAFDDAVVYLTEAVRKDPNNQSARRYLAHALAGAGSRDSAIEQFEALGKIDSLKDQDATIYARALESADKRRQAIDVLSAMLDHSKSPALRCEMASMCYRSGLKEQGDAVCKRGIELSSSEAEKAAFNQLLKNPPAVVKDIRTQLPK